MKFAASQSALLEGFMPLAGVVPSKTPLPALAHILAELKGNSLSLAATDLEVSMQRTIEVFDEFIESPSKNSRSPKPTEVINRSALDSLPPKPRSDESPYFRKKDSHIMRVLITGGAGFVGSHLADAYLERGDEVVVIDDLSTGALAKAFGKAAAAVAGPAGYFALAIDSHPAILIKNGYAGRFDLH